MYKIGVIGDYESICGFSAVGFTTFAVESSDAARTKLKELANSGYGIIYITEQFMQQLQNDCAQYDNQPTPCIIPIPTCTGSTGFGEDRLKYYVEQAIGSDIIFGDE